MSDFTFAQHTGYRQDGMAILGSESRMVVWFLAKSVLMDAASREAGRPVYQTQHYVHIQHPGERDFVERPAHGGDVERFPNQWKAYAAQQEQVCDGTPLSTLFPADPGLVSTLKVDHIHTVEQLANLTEEALRRLGMGAREWVKRAQTYLEAAKGMAQAHALQKQIDDKDAKITELTDRLEQLEQFIRKHQKKV